MHLLFFVVFSWFCAVYANTLRAEFLINFARRKLFLSGFFIIYIFDIHKSEKKTIKKTSDSFFLILFGRLF